MKPRFSTDLFFAESDGAATHSGLPNIAKAANDYDATNGYEATNGCEATNGGEAGLHSDSASAGDFSYAATERLAGELPRIRLSRLILKPVTADGGALLPLKGVTFSLSTGKIRHLIVQIGGTGGDASELYLPFDSARISAWRITPESHRPRSPKNTQRLLTGKPVFTTGGTYCGKLTDALIKNGALRLLYADGKPYSADALYAANDALLLRLAEPFPLGQPLPEKFRNEKSGDVPVRFSGQITRSVLRHFIRVGKLIDFTTSLPLFRRSFTSAGNAGSPIR